MMKAMLISAAAMLTLAGAAQAQYSAEYPSPDSYTPYGYLGGGGGGTFYQTGDYCEETFTGTGLSQISSARFQFSMYDCTPGGYPNDFKMLINGQQVGTYTLYGTGGGDSSFDLLADFSGSPISGPDYTIRLEATSTVFGGGCSWNWYAGGQVDLYGVPAPSALAVLGLGGLAAGRRRR